MHQTKPDERCHQFLDAQIVVLSTDLRALFWSLAEPGSPKHRFLMESMDQARQTQFHPSYGKLAVTEALERNFVLDETLQERHFNCIVLLAMPGEALLLQFEDAKLAFRWFQMVILALGLYYLTPGQNLLNNIPDRKANLIVGLRDYVNASDRYRILIHIAEKDSELQNPREHYKVFTLVSFKESQPHEFEFVIPYVKEVLCT